MNPGALRKDSCKRRSWRTDQILLVSAYLSPISLLPTDDIKAQACAETHKKEKKKITGKFRLEPCTTQSLVAACVCHNNN